MIELSVAAYLDLPVKRSGSLNVTARKGEEYESFTVLDTEAITAKASSSIPSSDLVSPSKYQVQSHAVNARCTGQMPTSHFQTTRGMS